MIISALLSVGLFCFTQLSYAATNGTTPQITIKNGTIQGTFDAQMNLDEYLGIPYSLPPTGPLRFQPPLPYNKTYDGVLQATAFGPVCHTGGGPYDDAAKYNKSEDCLTLNIIRPHGSNFTNLPVLVWIHGGGYYDGGDSLDIYNMDYLVQQSVNVSQPIMVVSIQYRLTGFGFLSSYQTVGAGATNLGLRDQRLGLHWIQENIAAFGGDPSKVTIWGQSAGSMSVAHQMLMYGGRNDSLFSGAILESGFSTSQFYWAASGPQYQGAYDAIVNYTNCSNAADTLACLRTVPEDTMAYAINITNGVTEPIVYLPIIDNDLVQGWPSDQVAAEKYVHVPSILLEADDEGGAFVILGLNTTDDLEAILQTWYSITNDSFDTLIDLYPNPDNGTYGVPFGVPNATIPPSFGTEYRQASAIIGDLLMTAPRRLMAKYLSQTQPMWSMHWNITDFNTSAAIGANHASEVAYVLDNPAQYYNITGEDGWNADPNSANIANSMSAMWIAFVTTGNPNNHNTVNITYWPEYNTSMAGTNMYVDLSGFSVENDTYRVAATDFMNSIPHQLNH